MRRANPPVEPDARVQDEPSACPGPVRPDRRETFTLAADLALVGVCIVASTVPLITAGAGLATASQALDHWLDRRSWPTFGELLRTLRSALLPGIVASLAAAVVTIALVLDIAGLASGRVPGGRPVLVITVVVAAGIIALAALTIVEVGRREARDWYGAIRAAGQAAYRRPVLPLAIIAALLPAVIIGWMIPVMLLILPGYGLFAVHVVRAPEDARRRDGGMLE